MSHHWQGSLTLHAGRPLGPGPAAAQRVHHGAVPGRAGSRRRTIAGGNRSAASAGLQRHLAGRARLPGERHLLLRVRPADAGGLRLRCARLQITSIDRLRLDNTIIPRERVCRRSHPPCRAAASAAGAAGRPRRDQRLRWKYSTCSTTRTTTTRLQRDRNQPEHTAQPVSSPEPLVRAADRAAGIQAHVLNL